MENSDVVFNLRLMNQKLDEELRLYRNGTTPEDLLELIEEKDTEIMKLRKNLADSADKLRRIAKGSAEVITKCDIYQKEIEVLKENEIKLKAELSIANNIKIKQQASIYKDKLSYANDEITELKAEIHALTAENETLNNTMDMLIPEAEQFQEKIESLEDDGIVRDTSIEKLQKRCHNLVLGQKERHKELEQAYESSQEEILKRKEQIKLLSNEIQKAQKHNATLKERVRTERTNAAQLSTNLLAALADVTKAQAEQAKLKQQLLHKNNNNQAKKTKVNDENDSAALNAKVTAAPSNAKRTTVSIKTPPKGALKARFANGNATSVVINPSQAFATQNKK